MNMLVECKNCGKMFERPIKLINHNRKRGSDNYCSISCANSDRKHVSTYIEVICGYCNKIIKRKPSSVKRNKSGYYFCCQEHKTLALRTGNFEGLAPSHYYTTNGGEWNIIRKRILGVYNSSCYRCGYNELEYCIDIHHIDHNKDNNSDENLVALCCNCHQRIHRGRLDSDNFEKVNINK